MVRWIYEAREPGLGSVMRRNKKKPGLKTRLTVKTDNIFQQLIIFFEAA
jgi:hypothetical protein